MKKKTAIAVIARRENYIRFMTEKLSLFLGDAADFHGYIIPDLPDTTILPEDCVVLSSYSIFQQVRPKLKKSARVIMLKRSLYRESLNDIRALQDGTSALLVNIDYKYCMEMITSLYREGNINLQLEPYYPGCEYDPNIRVAITPGETQLVPPEIQTVIDIGERAIRVRSPARSMSNRDAALPLAASIARESAWLPILCFGRSAPDTMLPVFTQRSCTNNSKYFVIRLASICTADRCQSCCYGAPMTPLFRRD